MRRVHVAEVRSGEVRLDEAQAHHVRDVLRLGEGAEVELFDAAGGRARGVVVRCTRGEVWVEAGSVERAVNSMVWTVACAVPKAARADWMVEKLGELGCAWLVPLQTGRSVVHPEGKGKRSRWERIATEAARQSRRSGVMGIAELMGLEDFLGQLRGPAWYLSTAPGALGAREAIDGVRGAGELTILIGPEGGWTAGELARFEERGLTAVSLGPTILRVETAAVAAGALVAAMLAA